MEDISKGLSVKFTLNPLFLIANEFAIRLAEATKSLAKCSGLLFVV